MADQSRIIILNHSHLQERKPIGRHYLFSQEPSPTPSDCYQMQFNVDSAFLFFVLFWLPYWFPSQNNNNDHAAMSVSRCKLKKSMHMENLNYELPAGLLLQFWVTLFKTPLFIPIWLYTKLCSCMQNPSWRLTLVFGHQGRRNLLKPHRNMIGHVLHLKWDHSKETIRPLGWEVRCQNAAMGMCIRNKVKMAR